MNHRLTIGIVAAALMTCLALTAHARGGGGGTGGGMGSGERMGGEPGGQSSSHMSNTGQRNTNGQESLDRDKGKARAEDRSGSHHANQSGNRHPHRNKKH